MTTDHDDGTIGGREWLYDRSTSETWVRWNYTGDKPGAPSLGWLAIQGDDLGDSEPTRLRITDRETGTEALRRIESAARSLRKAIEGRQP